MEKKKGKKSLLWFLTLVLLLSLVHFLKLKIRDMIKTDVMPDENVVASIKILSNYLPEAKTELDRSITRLEQHHAKLRRRSSQ